MNRPRSLLALAVVATLACAGCGERNADGDGRVTADGAAAMFKAMEANADGNVTAAEMDAAGGDARPSSAARIKAVCANGDGVLAAADTRTARAGCSRRWTPTATAGSSSPRCARGTSA